MGPIFRLVRIGNTVVSFAGTLVGGLVARGAGLSIPGSLWLTLILAGLSTSCVTAGGNALNDVLDLDGDRINHPDRPLVLGEVKLRTAQFLTAGLFVAAALFVAPVVPGVPLVGVILLVALGTLLSYEFRFKAQGFLGNLTVSLLTALVFLYGAAAAGGPALLVPFAGMGFLATLSREVIKDMEDVAGDVIRSTLPKTRGIPFSAMVARTAVVAAILLSFVPFLYFVSLSSVAGIIYLGLVAAADGLFVVSVVYLPSRLHWEQTVSKGAMAVALVAFLATAFR